jgi:hypothetical protein
LDRRDQGHILNPRRPAGRTSTPGNGLAQNNVGPIATVNGVDYPLENSLAPYRSQMGRFTGTAPPEPAPMGVILVGRCQTLRRGAGGADRTRG